MSPGLLKKTVVTTFLIFITLSIFLSHTECTHVQTDRGEPSVLVNIMSIPIREHDSTEPHSWGVTMAALEALAAAAAGEAPRGFMAVTAR